MPKDIDVFVISSQIGNERQITEDFRDYLTLVIKQISITRQTVKMIDEMRKSCLLLTNKLLNVIKHQMRIFRECQDSIYIGKQNRHIPSSMQVKGSILSLCNRRIKYQLLCSFDRLSFILELSYVEIYF